MHEYLDTLDDAAFEEQFYGTVIRTVFVPSDNGPNETGAAYASFIDGHLPLLKKYLAVTRAEFDDRAEAISQSVRISRNMPDTERAAEFLRLTEEILEANKVFDDHPNKLTCCER